MDIKQQVFNGDCRSMSALSDNSVSLVVTSPPYWQIKDYDTSTQIGYGQTLHDYLKDLYRVWKECFRVLKPGRRLCINIGDQFARSIVYGRYKIIPLHSECIAQCEQIGFDYMGSIIWQKKTTMNTTGGASVMGSFPYPPNGMIEIDYEFILIFKKPGPSEKIESKVKKDSEISKEDWKQYFCGHWVFGGARQTEHQAMFPEELPRRLIRMFSFKNELVLDPFLGSGTTMKVAIELGRNAVGYEINSQYIPIIKTKVNSSNDLFNNVMLDIIPVSEMPSIDRAEEYYPNIQDAKPIVDEKILKTGTKELYKVRGILNDGALVLDTGLKVKFANLTLDPTKISEVIDYLRAYVLNKEVILKYVSADETVEGIVSAQVLMKNKISVNKYLLSKGFGVLVSV